MFFAHVLWGPGALGGHSPQAFLITGLHAAKRAADTVKSYNLSFNISKEVCQKRPTGEHAALAPRPRWQQEVFGELGPYAFRISPYALYPHNPHQALYRLRVADLTRASRRAVLSEGVRGVIYIFGRDEPSLADI